MNIEDDTYGREEEKWLVYIHMYVHAGVYENDSVQNHECSQSGLPEMSYPFLAFSGN